MTKVEKTVRFYDTIAIDVRGDRLGVEDDFWSSLLSNFASRGLADRSASIEGVDYIGHAVSPLRPALPHLQVERIRDLAEQLNVSNLRSGEVEPLDFDDPNDRVSEPTFIVPFGSFGRVAVMSPAVQASRPETLGRWLTSVLDLVPLGYSIEFVPVVDPGILEKITGADGAVMLEVHVDAGVDLPTGGGAVGEAFRSAQKQELDEARLVFRWSLDRSGGTPGVRDALRRGALWVAQHSFSSMAKVKLANEHEGKIVRDEERSIFMDRITKSVKFETRAGVRASEEAILTAIGGAIREFNQGGTTLGSPAGTTGTAQITLSRGN